MMYTTIAPLCKVDCLIIILCKVYYRIETHDRETCSRVGGRAWRKKQNYASITCTHSILWSIHYSALKCKQKANLTIEKSHWSDEKKKQNRLDIWLVILLVKFRARLMMYSLDTNDKDWSTYINLNKHHGRCEANKNFILTFWKIDEL